MSNDPTTTPDVEGHTLKSQVDADAPDTDVEGHSRMGIDGSDAEGDVEGHGRMHIDGSDTEDDVEGHLRRI